MSWVEYVAFRGEVRNRYTQKSSGNRSPGRPMSILEGNIKIDLNVVGYEDLERVKVAQDSVQWITFVNTARIFEICE
jgi:hypothetical protein